MPHKPPLTIALVSICTLIYLGITMLELPLVRPLLISEYTQPLLPEIQRGQAWRLITPIFLHFGIFHIVFNMLWTWEFGRLIEARHGAFGLLGLSALIAMISNLGQYYVSGPVFGGMSGVIYGYFGYLWIQGLFNPTYHLRLNPPVVYMLLGWLLLGWSGIFTLLFDLHIANTAHTVGLLSGIVLAFMFILIRRRIPQ